MAEAKKTVVVAGARGFVGRALIERLKARFHVVGLARSVPAADQERPHEWRRADLFSLRDCEAALQGADFAIYLVHSMMPAARLTQGNFEDLDLILADNFARGAALNGVRQIVYLGGILPEGDGVSRHLRSRLEVEEALAAHGVPVTAVRAGLVVGAGGSSLKILLTLVQRLPLMVTPGWTETENQPIALEDLLRLLEASVGDESLYGQDFDVGGPEVLTYRTMMAQAAEELQVNRRIVPVSVMTPELSTAWVCLVTGAPSQLVGPLVQSLRHRMVVRDQSIQNRLAPPQVSYRAALKAAIAAGESAAPRAFLRPAGLPSTVRSVQRLPLPETRDAPWVANAYADWLPRFFRPLIRVDVDEDRTMRFFARFVPRPLLVLTYVADRSSPERALHFITGGLLARVQRKTTHRGRLEFRTVLGQRWVMAAIHDYEPRLPWFLYTLTQARVHLWVMMSFRRYLKDIAKDSEVS